ncbi:MAG: RNA-binding transcriptional accessory protein [Candidatus Marinimicrobia bacterium]|nr:RNA-binding transcriptional accessory protein [Candidatus Neomarinimicrobiota bacterium]
METKIFIKIAQELTLLPFQVEKTIQLVDEGNTVPFLARYRKEATGKLDEDQIRSIIEKIEFLRALESRKETILKTIGEQGKLTDELRNKIINCQDIQILEDLYLPYKPKKLTRATIAREKGLEPLASLILLQQPISNSILEIASQFIKSEHEVNTAEAALQGAKDILAEIFSDDADNRRFIREYTTNHGLLESSIKSKTDTDTAVFEMYFDYSEKISTIPSHRILAINRGENLKILNVKISIDTSKIIEFLKKKYIKDFHSIYAATLSEVIEDSYTRLISKAIEREIRNQLTEKAEEKAIQVFATNLKNLLLQPPLRNQIIMGIDPAFRTGCKVAIIDPTGKYLEGTTIFPHPPQNQYEDAKKILTRLVFEHSVSAIAIGNGTASRETEALVADLIEDIKVPELKYIIVDEAGASVYSASKIAKEEFPDLEASMRGNISIARRLLDPLSELVKIDPKSIGVGQYQHDVNQKRLTETLGYVIENCVNQVGVNVNTASSSLLQHVAGLTSRTAGNIIEYRMKHGKFLDRSELKNVPGIGLISFQQSAGFLRIPDSKNPLDNTAIHPESYEATKKLLKRYKIQNIATESFILRHQIAGANIAELAQEINIGLPTLEDILLNLEKPGIDPRDELPKPIFKSGILKIDDLKEGMVLKGTVRNVVDFGAFIDIGLKEAGLVHISQLANKFVKDPKEVVSVGDIVDVKIMTIDKMRGRIGLSMKDVL